MAELTKLEDKLGEVLGLAQAAQDATKKVARMIDDKTIGQTLARMHDEAAETERRCTDVASGKDGKKTAILGKARTTKAEAKEMMATYLGEDAEGLDGLEFLSMAEAGEVAYVEILGTLRDSLPDLNGWAESSTMEALSRARTLGAIVDRVSEAIVEKTEPAPEVSQDVATSTWGPSLSPLKGGEGNTAHPTWMPLRAMNSGKASLALALRMTSVVNRRSSSHCCSTS